MASLVSGRPRLGGNVGAQLQHPCAGDSAGAAARTGAEEGASAGPGPEPEPEHESDGIGAAALLWQDRDREAARLSEIIAQASASSQPPPQQPAPSQQLPPLLLGSSRKLAAAAARKLARNDEEDAERARLRALINGEALPELKRQCVTEPQTRLKPAGLLSDEGVEGFLQSVKSA